MVNPGAAAGAKRQRDQFESDLRAEEAETKRRRQIAADKAQEDVWIGLTLQRALDWNNVTQAQIDNCNTTEERRLLAIDYEIKKEWYWDWSVTNTRQWAADSFLKHWNLTRVQIYNNLIKDKFEPWMSINAFMGKGERVIHPNDPDMRVDELYNHTYPWAGFLVSTWWPRYGSNFDIIRRDSFRLRISHIIPDPIILAQDAAHEAELLIEAAKKLAAEEREKVEKALAKVYVDTQAGLGKVNDNIPLIAGAGVGVAVLALVGIIIVKTT